MEDEVQIAPAPWNLKGKSWVFIIPGLSKTSNFPSGFSASHDAEVLSGGGEFIGGPGLVQIISYNESPVGPYDELMYIPGRWRYADGTTGLRITRIFVSSKHSTLNGRRNWGIPKQVAKFDYKTGADGLTHLSVTLSPNSQRATPTTPFFKATLTPITLLSSLSIPLSTSPLGKYLAFIQPPLPAGNHPEEIKTDDWAELVPVQKGKAHVVYVTPELDGKLGDGNSFPAVVPWSMGVCMPNFELHCPQGKISKTR